MALSKTNQIIIGVVIVIIIIAAVAAVALSGDDDDDNKSDPVTVSDYSSDPVLWVRGNADGDYDIDSKDIDVINAIIAENGRASTYPWADANNDGSINSADVTFVQNMIDGKATTVYYKNIDSKICSYTVRDDINLVPVNKCQAEDVIMVTNTNSNVKIVGGDQQCKKYNNELALTWADSDPSKGCLVTGTSNGETQAEIIDKLLSYYGHVEICLGSSSSYGTNLENDFGSDKNVSIIRLPSWEDGTLNGVMTYGYLFGGVQKNACWDQAVKYYNWYMKYYEPIVTEVAKMSESDKPKVVIAYVTDCFPGATNKVLATGSGDAERSVICGANNVGMKYFTSGSYVAFTPEDMAACEKKYGIDYFIVEPSFVYGTTYTTNDYKTGVINGVQMGINALDGYLSNDVDIYSLSFMLTAGPGCPVSFAFYASTFFPDNKVLGAFDADTAWAEYLALIGWDKRTDVSDIVSYGPGHTTKSV